MRNRRVVFAAMLVAFGAFVLWAFVRTGSEADIGAAVSKLTDAPASEPAPVDTLKDPQVEQAHGVTRTSVGPELTSPTVEAAPSTPLVRGIRGRVVNDLNVPVPQFELEWRQPTKSSPEELFTQSEEGSTRRKYDNKDGAFALTGLSPGEWSVTAHGPGDTRSAPVLVAAPVDANEAVLVLPRSATVTGVVVAAGGAPVAAASVFVRYAGDDVRRVPWTKDPKPRAETDSQGRFRLDDVQPGSFQVMAAHSDYTDGEWTAVTVSPASVAEITLHLSQGGRVVGVVDQSLGDVADRQVDLFSFRGSIGWRTGRTDKLGRVVIERVMPQDYIIELRAPGYPRAPNPDVPSIRKQITVKDGETTDVVFGDSRRDIHVVGRVTRAAKAAVGLEVTAHSKAGGEDRNQSATTSETGQFELDVDGPGEYRFHVEAAWASYADFDRTISSEGGPELAFEIPGGAIVGSVVSPDGAAVARVAVTVLKTTDDAANERATFWKRYRRVMTDEHGEFEFALLEPGTYSLRAPDGFRRDSPPPRTPYGGVVIAELHVGDGPIDRLTVHLQPEGRISGQVVDAAGEPVAAAAIQVFDAAGIPRFAYWEVTTDVTGTFTIDSIAPGTYTVGAQRKERRATSAPLLVEANQTATALVKLP